MAPPRAKLDYMAFVEACYRIDQTPRAWLVGLAEAAVPIMGCGEGIHACLIDVSRTTPLMDPVLVRGRDSWEAEWRSLWWEAFMARLGPDEVKLLHAVSPVSYTSELWGAAQAASPTFGDYLPVPVKRRYSIARAQAQGRAGDERGPSGFRYPDSFNVSAIDTTGHGATLVANMSRMAEGSVHPSDVALWRRLSVHVTAGYRLLRGRTSHGDAAGVFEPDGRLVDVARSARDAVALAALRDRIVTIDRARAGQRDDWRATTEAWTGLLDGRWSLVDSFDREGRRYYLAYANAPAVSHDVLSEREAQVAYAAALGHSNKLIAYALGISASTVATHIKSAAHKLGLATRLELIRHLRDGQG
jgi:DNA-binding CsgD family transcriptional regulator